MSVGMRPAALAAPHPTQLLTLQTSRWVKRSLGPIPPRAKTDAASAMARGLAIGTTCLDRDLPMRLPCGGGHPVLASSRCAIDLAGSTALTPLSPTLRLGEGAGLHWRRLSHLKFGRLSLADGTGGPETLREMRRLYHDRDAPEARALNDAIRGVCHRRSTARVAGGGTARGLDVGGEMDGRSSRAAPPCSGRCWTASSAFTSTSPASSG